MAAHLGHDVADVAPFTAMEGIGGIAILATQRAAGQTHEHGGPAHAGGFALQGQEDLGDLQPVRAGLDDLTGDGGVHGGIMRPVSYTHLDVYKRQTFSGPDERDVHHPFGVRLQCLEVALQMVAYMRWPHTAWLVPPAPLLWHAEQSGSGHEPGDTVQACLLYTSTATHGCHKTGIAAA